MSVSSRREYGARAQNASAQPTRLVSPEDLQRIKVFSHLGSQDFAAIAGLSSICQVRKGAEIITRRAEERVACFAIDAQINLTILAPSGRQVILRTVRPGDHFGEDCSIGGGEQTDVTAVAETAGEYVELACVHFRRLLQDIPSLCFAMLETIAARSTALLDRVFELSVLELRYRLLAEIVRLAHAGTFKAGVLVINPAPTHEHFAIMVGGTREGVTRELRLLSQQGFVEVRRKELRVLNLERLKSLLASRAGVRPLHLEN
jgi:CRP-like cAMP-binding protein